MATEPPDPSEGSGMKEAAAIQRRTPSPGSESSASFMNVSQESFTFSPPPKPDTKNPAPQEEQAQQELIGDAQLRLEEVFATISDDLQYLATAHHLLQLYFPPVGNTPGRYDDFLTMASKILCQHLRWEKGRYDATLL